MHELRRPTNLGGLKHAIQSHKVQIIGACLFSMSIITVCSFLLIPAVIRTVAVT